MEQAPLATDHGGVGLLSIFAKPPSFKKLKVSSPMTHGKTRVVFGATKAPVEFCPGSFSK